LELTNVDQCYWVPSDLNPADIATKTSSFTSMHKWFDGIFSALVGPPVPTKEPQATSK